MIKIRLYNYYVVIYTLQSNVIFHPWVCSLVHDRKKRRNKKRRREIGGNFRNPNHLRNHPPRCPKAVRRSRTPIRREEFARDLDTPTRTLERDREKLLVTPQINPLTY